MRAPIPPMLASLSKEMVGGPEWVYEEKYDGIRAVTYRDGDRPFDPAPRISSAVWVMPRLVAQLAYAEWTADGKLRQSAFLRLRTDKKPEECTWARRE